MKLYEIISNLKFVGIKNYLEQDIDSLSCNSLEKLRNGMYFCLSGTKTDGHNFAKESIANGATCLVLEKYLDLPCTQILVENAREVIASNNIGCIISMFFPIETVVAGNILKKEFPNISFMVYELDSVMDGIAAGSPSGSFLIPKRL